MKVYDYYNINLAHLCKVLEEENIEYSWGIERINERTCHYLEFDEKGTDIEWQICMKIMGREICGECYKNFKEVLNEVCELNHIHMMNGFDATVYIKPVVIEIIPDFIDEDIEELEEIIDSIY